MTAQITIHSSLFYNSLSRFDLGGHLVTSGVVMTDAGPVDVWSDESASYYALLRGGRVYRRREEQGRTKRGLAIIAGRFAREVLAAIESGEIVED